MRQILDFIMPQSIVTWCAEDDQVICYYTVLYLSLGKCNSVLGMSHTQVPNTVNSTSRVPRIQRHCWGRKTNSRNQWWPSPAPTSNRFTAGLDMSPWHTHNQYPQWSFPWTFWCLGGYPWGYAGPIVEPIRNQGPQKQSHSSTKALPLQNSMWRSKWDRCSQSSNASPGFLGRVGWTKCSEDINEKSHQRPRLTTCHCGRCFMS